MRNVKHWLGIGTTLAILALVGCAKKAHFEYTQGANLTGNPVVCDPFGGGGSTNSNQGIQGTLHYIPNGSKGMYSTVAQFFSLATLIPIDLFLGQINVPTRMFSAGFPTDTGEFVKTLDNETLIEFFGVKLRGRIRLAPDDQEGHYQFAVLSDDGSVFTFHDGGDAEYVDFRSDDAIHSLFNDNDHPTKLKVADWAIAMNRDSKYKFNLEYYQGPRYHISMILMWRRFGSYPVTSSSWASNFDEPLDGQLGNSHWFNPNVVPSQATANYNALLSRGWKPLKPENFILENDDDTNPCAANRIRETTYQKD